MSDIQEKIDALLTPVELAYELESGIFNTGQAESIASDVYQPLFEIIKLLNVRQKDDAIEITGVCTAVSDTSIRELMHEKEQLKSENEALKAEIGKLKSESEWVDIKDSLPAYGEPVMVLSGAVQHIVYCMDGPGDDSDTTAPWFCPYYFDHDDDLVIPYRKVKKWKYVDDLMVQ